MQIVEAIIFEPVGCLAEFPAAESYCELVNKIGRQARPNQIDCDALERWEEGAVNQARPYEDVVASLSELQGLGVTLVIATSLSTGAMAMFLDRHSLAGFFAGVWTRDLAGGVKSLPLARALAGHALKPASVLFVTDTASGLEQGRRLGVNPILMMNDPDEAMRLTAHQPAGGIVSLHELPDLVRFVAAENARFAGKTAS
jgi:phosphoglycolate phosphatase-like HAD superfamily hydrolase